MLIPRLSNYYDIANKIIDIYKLANAYGIPIGHHRYNNFEEGLLAWWLATAIL